MEEAQDLPEKTAAGKSVPRPGDFKRPAHIPNHPRDQGLHTKGKPPYQLGPWEARNLARPRIKKIENAIVPGYLKKPE